MAAPWSPWIQPRGPRTEGEEREAGLRGRVRMEGSCGVAVPLVSGGRSSEEAGKGRFPVAVSLFPLLPSYPGSCLPSFHPSFPPSLIHLSTAHPPAVCPTGPQPHTPPLSSSSVLPPFIPSSAIPPSLGLACGVTWSGPVVQSAAVWRGTPEKTPAQRGGLGSGPGGGVVPGPSVGQ